MADQVVVACPGCGAVRAAEARHASSTCVRCGERHSHAAGRVLASGVPAAAAREIVARAAAPQGPAPAPRVDRHDDPLDAAAAKGRAIANRSARAEAVALWCCRLLGGAVRHAQLLDALQRAGLDADRAEQEVVRMLACDLLLEPRPGLYRLVEA